MNGDTTISEQAAASVETATTNFGFNNGTLFQQFSILSTSDGSTSYVWRPVRGLTDEEVGAPSQKAA